jgi:hypothetical protein
MMNETTDQNDGERPLSPEERTAMRKLLRVIDTKEKVESVEKIVKYEPVLVEVATNYAHMSWFTKMLYKTGIWFAGIVAALVAYTNFKSWAGIK